MNRGNVVEVDWLYTDLTGSKTRPAVVVQADYLNGLIDDTILVQITSSGLSKVCVASCINVMTFEQVRVLRTIGNLSSAAMLQIEACLKAVFEIR